MYLWLVILELSQGVLNQDKFLQYSANINGNILVFVVDTDYDLSKMKIKAINVALLNK